MKKIIEIAMTRYFLSNDNGNELFSNISNGNGYIF